MAKDEAQKQQVRKFLIVAVVSAAWLLLMLSLGSFRTTDWPTHGVYPANEVHNLCGPLGSLLAYCVFWVIGHGAYPVMLFAAACVVVYIAKGTISDMWLRGIGVALIAVAFASLIHVLRPGAPDAFPEGQGGVIGIAVGNFLKQQMNFVGAMLILLTSLLVGLVLAADELVVAAPAAVSHTVNKLREVGAKLPSVAESSQGRTVAAVGAGVGERSAAGVGAFASGILAKLKSPFRRDYAVLPGPSSVPEEDLTPSAKPVLLNRHNLSEREIDLTYDNDHAVDSSHPAAAEAVEVLEIAPAEESGDEVEEDGGAEAMEASSDGLQESGTAAVASVSTTVEGEAEKATSPAGLPAGEPQIRMTPRPLRPATPAAPRELGNYTPPTWEVLADPEPAIVEAHRSHVKQTAQVLEDCLREFKLDARVVSVDTGPVITMYEISLAAGIKVSSITALQNDIARALKAISVRIVAPVPGKDTVGIEVPNVHREIVRLKELFELAPAAAEKMTIPLYLGKDTSGEPLVTDLTAMPHCLIAGTTGSGKSFCINTIIMSIVYTQRPDTVKLILVDPKVVEMAAFKDIPHLMCPVINDPNRATAVLEWACNKMDERYGFLAEAQVRNIASYNKLTREELMERFRPSTPEEEAKIPKFLPYIVIIIDELADLMMTSGKEVEASIVRLAQKSRAVGIHLIVATQRPQATVVTGLIKANLPSRIAFRVQSRMDSRIVLDQQGADLLLGKGDMLFMPPGANKPIRAQGTYLDDLEIRASVKKVKELAEAQYEPELVQIKAIKLDGTEEKDELFEDAVRVVLETKRGSVSLLQRRLNVGYARASRMIEMMAHMGIVGEFKGEGQPREATMTVEEYEQIKAQMQKDADDGMTV